MSQTSGEPRWLALEPEPVLVFLHSPGPTSASGTAVLLCPPFGWEEMCSYRGRRIWALELAAAGYPAARLSFPGSGDSAGTSSDPGRLQAWTSAVSGAAQWLGDVTGAARVAALGIGLGGMLACAAAADGAPIDDLILWAVPARGRVLVRELRTYARVIAAKRPEDHAQREETGEFIGFRLTRDTIGDLESLDLTTHALPGASTRRVLMLERDGLPIDKSLLHHFERSGAAVAVQSANDYGSLMMSPQDSQPPHSTIEKTISWLSDPGRVRPLGSRAPAGSGAVERDCIEFRWGGSVIRETPLRFEGGRGSMFGMLSESSELRSLPVCAVWLGGGALAHPGPNRLWVEVARRWAARGVRTVRVDLAGIGDSDCDEPGIVANPGLYEAGRTVEALSVLDQLGNHGLPERFILGGLCSGAYWALHAALSDSRVAAALMINLYAFFWSEDLVAERETRDSLQALRGYGWRRLVRRDVTAERLMTRIRSLGPTRLRAGARHPVERAQGSQIELALDRLQEQQTEALLLLSRGEGLFDQLQRLGALDQGERWPNLAVERIPSTDHMFRALWLQRRVHESLDRALDRVLARSSEERPLRLA